MIFFFAMFAIPQGNFLGELGGLSPHLEVCVGFVRSFSFTLVLIDLP